MDNEANNSGKPICCAHGALSIFIVVTQMTTNDAQVRRIKQRLFGNNRKLKL